MLSPLDFNVICANSESFGVKASDLVRNAGRALANVVHDMYSGKRILFACGLGSNGRIGFIAASILRNCDIALLRDFKIDNMEKIAPLVNKKTIVYSNELLGSYDVLVDCVSGIDSEDVNTFHENYIDTVNSSGMIVVSCDVPSGFGTDLCVKPDVTVTFHDMKYGMNEKTCGRIIVSDIGIPPESWEIVGHGDMLRYPIPKCDSHKGQNGKLLIIGGGPYVGAPVMAGMAALRVGADIVDIATPEIAYNSISGMSPLLIVHKLDGNYLTRTSLEKVKCLTKNCSAVLIGPGLGQNEETRLFLLDFLRFYNGPTVIDADGISMLKGMMLSKSVLYTPHCREFRDLVDGKDVSVEEAAIITGSVIVLKGKIDIISDGRRTRRNITGTPAMTVGGTGDVLAGVIAGLVAKGMSYFNAGCLGAYLCGKAGEKSFNEFSYGLLATDIVDNIARVLKDELG
ncbi:MAG: NAD(P)H-hydrate dehydratase [archaeon]|nr:NAD(P)H-hydrate dehydratase [archaeon]